jgi:hypothetical protein
VRRPANVSPDIRSGGARGGQVVDGADAGGAQPVALHGSHPRDEQQVAMGDDLRIAGRASAARHDPELAAVVSPRDRSARRAGRDVAVGDERAQSLPAQPEDGHEVADGVRRGRAVAEQQLHPAAARHSQPVELVGICRSCINAVTRA